MSVFLKQIDNNKYMICDFTNALMRLKLHNNILQKTLDSYINKLIEHFKNIIKLNVNIITADYSLYLIVYNCINFNKLKFANYIPDITGITLKCNHYDYYPKIYIKNNISVIAFYNLKCNRLIIKQSVKMVMLYDCAIVKLNCRSISYESGCNIRIMYSNRLYGTYNIILYLNYL